VQSHKGSRSISHIATFLGLDVHKSSISIAFASAIIGQEPQFVKKILNDPRKLLKAAAQARRARIYSGLL